MSPKTDFRLALSVLVLSGTAALGHEILWTRRLIDLLGATPESSARVFECFFLGLSLGSLSISLLIPRIRSFWKWLAMVEFGVALLCIPVLKLPEATNWIWPHLGIARLIGWQGSVVKAATSICVMLPATFLMGMTLPLAAAATLQRKLDVSGREIWLYAANTFGGVLGLGGTVLVLLNAFGVAQSMLFMIAINLIVASACFWRSQQRHEMTTISASKKEAIVVTERTQLGWAVQLVLAFFSGAGILSLEVLGLAMANLTAPVAIYPQACILVCVILLLAVSAWVVPKIVRPKNVLLFLSPCLAAAGIAIALSPLIFTNLPSVANSAFGYGNGFPQFLWSLTIATFFTFGPALLIAGTVFPSLVSLHAGGVAAPQKLGLLLAVNGLGGIFGAETCYRLLLPSFAVYVSIGVVGACYALAAFGVLLATKTQKGIRYAFPVVALLATCWLTGARLVDLSVYSYANLFKIVDMRTGREGSLIVAEDSRNNRDMIFDNQYTLGGSASTPSMRREAHLPLLFHPSPRRVGFIGFGTGITASGAAEHAAVRSITAIELSPLVSGAGERNFAKFNHDITRDPRFTLHNEDARIYLEAAKSQFDVIIGDLFTPWRPGEASLSSLEHFQSSKEALRSEGVFCQWLELTQWTPQQFEIAAATFKKVFTNLYLVHTSFKTDKIPLGFLGFKQGKPDWNIVSQRCLFEATTGRLVDPLCRHPEGVAALYLGEYVAEPDDHTPINTLGNLLIELNSCRQRVAGNVYDYYTGGGGAWIGLVERQLASMHSRRELPETLQRYPDAGLYGLRFEIACEEDSPSKMSAARDFLAQIPKDVASDEHSDWSLWPTTILPWDVLGVKRR